VPIGWVTEGANRNDSILLASTLDDVKQRGLLADIETLWLDRGYDSALTRTRLIERGINDAMIAKKRKRGSATGTRHQPMVPAVAGRAHQLLAEKHRPAEKEHRPVNRTPTGPLCPGCCPDHHRQTGEVGQALGLNGCRLMARALNRVPQRELRRGLFPGSKFGQVALG
jgi:hypothetical protein